MKPRVLGKITPLTLTKELYDQLPRLMNGSGGYQDTFRRIYGSVRVMNGRRVAHLTPKDLEKLREWANREYAGSWQDWARAALSQLRE